MCVYMHVHNNYLCVIDRGRKGLEMKKNHIMKRQEIM